MKKAEYNTSELRGAPVYEARKSEKRIGKVQRFVFHPRKRQVIGFTVKRPDIALMAHRADLFVALDSFDVSEGKIIIGTDAKATGAAACRRLGVKWDECVFWQGMPLLTQEGTRCGFVGDVRFRTEDGAVVWVKVDRGAGADLLLGTAQLAASDIVGFKLGVGDELDAYVGDEALRGGVVVKAEALSLAESPVGGLAAAAGKATAQAAHKVSQAADKAKPVASDLAGKAGDAVGKGAFALGEQLSKTKGMFAGFKDAYKSAASGEEGDAK